MRHGDVALAVLPLLTAAFCGSLLHARWQEWQSRPAAELVRELRLTDLCLFTEARYTRHPSQADLHTPFQDHPMALEHFPTGALLGPPPHLSRHAPLAEPTALSD